jgi:hypothetical protein
MRVHPPPETACDLLHNMSVPPKSTVRYVGLAGLVDVRSPGGAGVTTARVSTKWVHGTPVRVEWLHGPPASVDDLYNATRRAIAYGSVADRSGRDPHRVLMQAINQCAAALPLPPGCAVIPSESSHVQVWTDVLTVLAVLSKCSDTVWLRDKTPSLTQALAVQGVSLLVPPAFAHRLKENT